MLGNCVLRGEGETHTNRQTDKQRQRDGDRETETQTETEKVRKNTNVKGGQLRTLTYKFTEHGFNFLFFKRGIFIMSLTFFILILNKTS